MRRWCVFLLCLAFAAPGFGEIPFEGKAVWVHPQDLGKNQSEVQDFFVMLEKCGINVVFPLMKNTGGEIFWHSEKFVEAVHPDYRDFDLLEAAVRYARQHQIKIHPWLCDLTESKDSPAFRQHPEWAMLNPQGGNTSEEKLGQGRPYNAVWMCPVRRPGYVDQWLIPMIEEICARYEVDGIHHDYVRYPGDVAPDSYCFCDCCLDHYMTYNHFFYSSRPHDRISLKIRLPRKEANWHYDLTLRPPDWPQMSRAEKAAYILEGISINRNDMDYYFYQTRVDAITRFIKESTEKAEKINPEIVISAAVFINPMRSARHTGQKWTDFVRWMDILAPMNYRSHFQGSFKAYLDYLSEYVQAQKKWCGGESLVYAGISGHYIYREEREHWEKAVKILSSEEAESRESELRLVMAEIIPRLERVAPKRAKGLDVKYSSYLRKTIEKEVLLEEIKNILTDPPVNLFPRKKLLQTIRAVKTAGADGISFFSAGILSRNKLWPALERIFVKKR